MKKNFQAINKFLIENDYELFGINNVKYINNELQLCDSFTDLNFLKSSCCIKHKNDFIK